MGGLSPRRGRVETVKVVAVLGSVMTDPLAARVRASPDATAVIDAASGEGLTYAALDGRVGRQAAALADREVGSGDHVAIACGVGTASVTLVHAVARLGATLVPLSARLTAGELEARVRRADCEVLVVGAGIERLASAIDGAPIVPIEELAGEASGETDGKADGGEFGETGEFDGASGTGEMDGTDEERATGVGRAGRAGAMGRALDDPLAIVFTSGTTGRPKGVVLTAGNVLASAGASAARLGVLPDDRWLLALSPGSMGGLAPIYRSVLAGTALVLQEEFDPQGTLRALSAHECTGVSLVPTMLDRMLAELEAGDEGRDRDNGGNRDGGEDRDDRGDRNEGFPPGVRSVLLGGAPASQALIERCRSYGVPVCPTYGMTETASQVATARPAEAFANPGTVGRPLVGVEAVAVENGDVLGADERGELVVSGPIVTPGYYGRTGDGDGETDRKGGDGREGREGRDGGEGTAGSERFTEHGFHTGDLGYVDQAGRVFVTGRLDDRIVTGGQTVDPEEVRSVLRAHPAVRDAAVLGLDDEQWGERVGALVVTGGVGGGDAETGANASGGKHTTEGGNRAGRVNGANDHTDDGGNAAVSAAALEAFCRERLARYKLPRTIAFAEALPRTNSGTVDRVAVARRLRDAGGN